MIIPCTIKRVLTQRENNTSTNTLFTPTLVIHVTKQKEWTPKDDLDKPTHTLGPCWMPKPLPSGNQCTGWFAPAPEHGMRWDNSRCHCKITPKISAELEVPTIRPTYLDTSNSDGCHWNDTYIPNVTKSTLIDTTRPSPAHLRSFSLVPNKLVSWQWYIYHLCVS